VLKWILDRSKGQAGGVEHMFGTTPTYGDLNWNGLSFTEEQFVQITSIDKDAWREELKLHTELFDKLSYRLPQALVATKERLEKHLGE
jgi:phosphoenolpyruvate carboxykinase (GTP)